MDRVLLAVYGLQVLQKQNEQILSNFGNNLDFLKVFHDFADYSLKNVEKWPRTKKSTLVFSCAQPATMNEEAREVYGVFDAGRDGDRFRVRDFTPKEDGEEVDDTIHVDRHHHSTRDVFFYLYVPKMRKRAYLVLQRAESHGIKELLMHLLRKYMNLQGLEQYRVCDSNLINDKVFTTMMEKGFFKELILTKHGIPEDIKELNNKDVKVPVFKGSVRTIYQATDLGRTWKDWAAGLIGASRQQPAVGNAQVVVEIAGEQKAFDEVSMRLDLNGKQKTFHVANTGRIQPDLDVTSNIEFDRFGNPKLADLLAQARDLEPV